MLAGEAGLVKCGEGDDQRTLGALALGADILMIVWWWVLGLSVLLWYVRLCEAGDEERKKVDEAAEL